MRAAQIILFALLCMLRAQVEGELISTNLINGDRENAGNYYVRQGVTKNLSVPAGKQLVIHGINLSSTATTSSPAFVRTPVSTGQNINIATVAYNSALNLWWNGPIVGPINIEYGLSGATSYSSSTFEPTYCSFLFEIKDSTLEASSATTASISSASVVVPSNAVGDVDVLLEQSNDMITWTQCLPGTYNASTQKRFFRVRAVEK